MDCGVDNEFSCLKRRKIASRAWVWNQYRAHSESNKADSRRISFLALTHQTFLAWVVISACT